ncbi:hypothetical protein EV126DRAFT_66578 [Verticillium dahliae]|nr:hypothetical protein EV126DRAFT_66578 [Verticillium dahliae]
MQRYFPRQHLLSATPLPLTPSHPQRQVHPTYPHRLPHSPTFPTSQHADLQASKRHTIPSPSPTHSRYPLNPSSATSPPGHPLQGTGTHTCLEPFHPRQFALATVLPSDIDHISKPKTHQSSIFSLSLPLQHSPKASNLRRRTTLRNHRRRLGSRGGTSICNASAWTYKAWHTGPPRLILPRYHPRRDQTIRHSAFHHLLRGAFVPHARHRSSVCSPAGRLYQAGFSLQVPLPTSQLTDMRP